MKKILVALFALLVARTTHAADMKEWTFLVFMNAHGTPGAGDDLSPFAQKNLDWMQSVGSNDQNNVVVEVGTSDAGSVQRVFVQQGNIQVIQNIENANMGSSQELLNFIQWAVQNYPAKHYFIDVWNHGMGWHAFSPSENSDGSWKPGPSATGSQFHIQDISFDFKTKNYITTEQMGDVMRSFAQLIGHKVDIYGSDACLMAMAEVAGEMQDSVQYFVGSQEEEPMDGWPYDKFLARWNAQPGIDGAGISKILVEEYYNYYMQHPDGSNIGVTLSAYNMDGFANFVKAATDFKTALISASGSQKDALMTAIASTDHYNDDPDYKDAYHLVVRAKAMGVNVEKSAMDNMTQAIQGLVIANKATGNHEGNSYGISVWLPTPADVDVTGINYYSDSIQRYENLKFDQVSHWSDLLTSLNAK